MLSALYWHSLTNLPVALLVSFAVAGFTIWLYPPQVRLLGSIWRWGLPGLRAIAMGAIAVSILKPVLIRPKTAIERGAVVLLVDDSKSMGVIDSARNIAQRVALAGALGQLPAGAREAATASLQSDTDRLTWLSDAIARARGEIDYARLAGRGVDVAQTRLDQTIGEFKSLAQSALDKTNAKPGQTGLRRTLGALAQVPPAGTAREGWLDHLRDQVRSAGAEAEQARVAADEQLFRSDPAVHDAAMAQMKLSRLQLSLTAARGAHGLLSRLGPDVPVLGFGVGERITPFAAGNSGASPSAPLEPQGLASNLTGAVRAVLDHLEGTPVRALVLFSDGRQVGGDATVPSGLSASGVPIYTIAVAPSGGVKDLSILHASAPTSAFVGETITFRAEVRAIGLANASADVTFEAGDIKQTRHLTFSSEKPIPIEFSQKMTTPGPQKMSLAISSVPGEATTENNTIERWVKVLEQKIQVAAYAGAASWDFQYVRNGLSRTPWAQLKDGILPDATARFPLSPDEILKQDVVLLFDVAAASLDGAQWDAINRLVTERGGSVILVAGDSHLPGEYGVGPVTSGLLPYRGAVPPTWRTWPGERPAFHLAVATGANTIDALKMGDDSEPTERRWQQLPAFFRYLPVSSLKPNSRPLLVESESGAAVLTESRLGIGRVLFFGANETWRWRYKLGERDQDRFWLQLIRYAAEEPFAVNKDGVSLDADTVTASPRTPVHVRARVLGKDGLPQKVQDCQLKIFQYGQNIRTQSMSVAGPEKSGRYQAIVTDLPPGKYVLRLDPGQPLATPEIPLLIENSSETELADLSGDETVLRRLAQSSGGEFLRIEQMDALPGKLTETRDEQARFVQTSLWDSPYLFAFVLGCLGAEWGLRKRLGLA